MRDEGMTGLVRGRKTVTTIPAKDGVRAGDLLNRQFTAPRPNHTWVTDFTYVATWSGFVYVAFAIDLFSLAIVGWQASTVKDTAFVEACLKMALWRLDQTGRPIEPGMIHHSDAGSQQRPTPQLPRQHPARGIRAQLLRSNYRPIKR
jgi:transposase InsO family protein